MKKLLRKIKVAKEDLERYLLPTDKDYQILGKIYELEKKDLSEEDKRMIALIRTQLEDDWRTPLIDELDSILRKY